MDAAWRDVNGNCCNVGCLNDATCHTSMHSSPLHPWLSIHDASIPYSSPASTHYLRHHYHHRPQYNASPWLSSVVERHQATFIHHQQRCHDDHDRCRHQQQNHAVAGALAVPSHSHSSELDGRPWTQLSPRDGHQHDVTDLMTGKTQQQEQQQLAKHQDSASSSERAANKTSSNATGI